MAKNERTENETESLETQASAETPKAGEAPEAGTEAPAPRHQRPKSAPPSWIAAGWSPGAGGLGIAGTARKPGAPGTHVAPSPDVRVVKVDRPAPFRSTPPASRAPEAPLTQGERPVVRVSLAQAAAAGNQTLRPLSPVATRTSETVNRAPQPAPAKRPAPFRSGPPKAAAPKAADESAANEKAETKAAKHEAKATQPIEKATAKVEPIAKPPAAAPVAPVAPVAPPSPAEAPASGPKTAPWARPINLPKGPVATAREAERPAPRREVAPAEPLAIPDPDARHLAVEGLSSPACVNRVERAVRAVPGVTEAEANLAAGVVAVAPASADPAAVAAALAAAGHPPLDEAPGAAGARKGARSAALAAAGTLAVGIVAAVVRSSAGNVAGIAVSLLAFATAWTAVAPGLRHLIRARLSAEVLPLLASLAILGVSVGGAPGAAPELAFAPLFVHLVGLALSRFARARALGILEGLRRDLPADHGQKAGQTVAVEAGGVIPVDGRLLAPATLDERPLGGEDEVERRAGEGVAAGTVATSGATLIATAPPSRSRLRRGLAIAERALSTHPSGTPSQIAATLVVPVALAAAIAAGFLAGAWVGAAVLAGTAPLALGFASSLASAAAVTRAASRGVAVRSSDALDRAGRTEVVLLDKTSTLTRGDTAVLELLVKPGRDAGELLGRIAAAQAGIDSPIARALLTHAEELRVRVPEAKDRRYEPGLGVRARVEGTEILVGSIHHATRCGVEIGLLAQTVDDIAKRGHTPLVAAVDGETVAVLGLADTPHESARQAVGSLELLEVQVRIASGDASHAVQWLAEGIGLDRKVSRGDLSPDAKRALVEELRAEGPTLVAGASVVDVPALAAADLAVAASAAPEVEAKAGALLMRQDPQGVVELLRAGRAARRARHLATGFGLAGNVAAIGLAGIGAVGVGGAAALALATTVLAFGTAASPWVRIR